MTIFDKSDVTPGVPTQPTDEVAITLTLDQWAMIRRALMALDEPTVDDGELIGLYSHIYRRCRQVRRG